MSEELLMPHIPRIDNIWTTGTIIAASASILSMLTVGGTIVWFSAHVDGTIQSVPSIISQQITLRQDVAVLQSQMQYTNVRYAEIQLALANINEKLDRRGK